MYLYSPDAENSNHLFGDQYILFNSYFSFQRWAVNYLKTKSKKQFRHRDGRKSLDCTKYYEDLISKIMNTDKKILLKEFTDIIRLEPL